MPRLRAFDETRVLDTAMHVFRARGCTALSIRDIAAAMGLSVGSLYNAWGDKDGILRAAMRHYLKAVVRARLDAYAGPGAGLDDLRGLFLSLFEMPQADGNGCLVTNSAVEFGRGPSPVAEEVAAGLAMVETAIRAVLARHLSAGRVETATARLVLLYHGLLVMARTGHDAAPLRQAVVDEFDRLKTPP